MGNRTQLLEDCILCPRECHVNRNQGMRGYCRVTSELVVARAALHMWEEPCISGKCGSGTVFFSGCSMGCVFCQNQSIASGEWGKKIPVSRLADIFLKLQEQGAANINLVTALHYIPQVMEGLDLARSRGLRLPVVYNSSGYEKAETLRMLEGYVDVYLPDFKFMDSQAAQRYSNAPDYSRYAKDALREMVRQTGEAAFKSNGMIMKGVIVRHLILPGHTKDSMEVLKYLYETYGDQIYISIMNQYTPMEKAFAFPEINRKVTDREYRRVVDYAIGLGVTNGFIQEGETALESFIPDFHNIGV